MNFVGTFIPSLYLITSSYLLNNNEFNGELEVNYAWSLKGVDSLDGSFLVKNNSNETVYYSGYENALNQENWNSWIKQNKKIKAIKIKGEDSVKEQFLKPGDSVEFGLAVPQNDKPFEAGFTFWIGEEHREKIIWTKVKKQIKSSVGFYCNDKMIAGNNILAQTCFKLNP